MVTLNTEEDDRVMADLFGFGYIIDDGVDNLILLEGQHIESMPVQPHRSLKAARSRRFVNLQQVLLLVDLQEGTDVVRLGEQQT